MWLAIGILGVTCFAAWLLLDWRKMVRARSAEQDSILEKIAKVYLERRQTGETMNQIKDVLHKHYSISRPMEFLMGYYNPIPSGNIVFAAYVKKMPEDALALGEITYTILRHRGIYPMPSEGQGVTDSAYEYDAMTKICNRFKKQMTALEAAGKKIDPGLSEMMKRWSALDGEIATANATWEKTLEGVPSEPERPEMLDKTEGIPPSKGLFGTTWLMTMNEVLEVVPQSVETTHDAIRHFGKYHGRRATFSYYFEKNTLTEISVCLNDSSEKDFVRMQARLSADFGPMPSATPTNHYDLLSRGEFDGLEIKHWLKDIEPIGVTEMIWFRKAK